MLDTPCSEVVWRVLATHSIHQFPLHFPSRASPCAMDGMDGPGIEYRWKRYLPHPSRPTLEPTQSSVHVKWVPGLFTRDKAAVAWRWLPNPSNAEVQERVGLCLYSPFGPLLAYSRVNFRFYFFTCLHKTRKTYILRHTTGRDGLGCVAYVRMAMNAHKAANVRPKRRILSGSLSEGVKVVLQ